MKVVILGSGVIGTTSAWFLAGSGHEVVVLDRQPGPALETSFANAGQISPGYASPWAAPGIPLKALKWLFMQHSPLFIRPSLDPAMLRFAFALLRNCSAAAYAVNKSRMVPIAEYSRDMLKALRAETGIAYDERAQGTLQLFRTDKLLAGASKDVSVLADLGVPHALLDPDGCIAAEPALARVRGKFVGGLRLPGDETGDCFKFTNALRDLAAARGVEFRYGVGITGLIADGDRLAGVATDQGQVAGDAYVLALGCQSPRMLAPHGIALPVYPVKGYSLTVPITDPSGAPEIDGDGREVQGGDHPARRPNPRRRHGRARRLLDRPAPEPPCDARACGLRPLPGRGRREGGQLLGRPSADDAGRPAGDRPGEVPQPLAQHRPRDARLDHGLRIGRGAGRPRLRPASGDRRSSAPARPVYCRRRHPHPRREGNPTMTPINAAGAPAAIGPYCHAVKVGDLLFTSGQIPLTLEGDIPAGIEAQTEQVFDNLAAVLAEAGTAFDRVVKATVFVTDLGDFAKLNTIYEKRFGGHKPARSTVQVAGLPRGVSVEIELIADLA